uniref:Uncharacterized protein n=1 Tax=Tanacetum cinerariifolium TaxID=118510 RepID=A0A699IMP6_TANCI|nr:hypothetical protein [Tanacetum cinerariifolium]
MNLALKGLIQVVIPGAKKPSGILLLKLELCTNLQSRVLDLEKIKTAQAYEINSSKRRVKKLKRRSNSITHKLERLYKLGLTARVESSGDEQSVEMFDVDELGSGEIFVKKQSENVVKKVVDIAKVSTAATTADITTEDITDKDKRIIVEEPVKPKKKDQIRLDEEAAKRVLDLEKIKTAQAYEIDSSKRKVKKLKRRSNSRTHKLERLYKLGLTTRVESSGDEQSVEMFDVDELGSGEIFVKKQSENVVKKVVDIAKVSTAATTADITTEDITDKDKRIIVEEPVKPKKKDQIRLDEEAAKRLQVKEQEELSDAEKPTLFTQLLEKRRKHFAAKRSKEKRNKPPTQAQKRKIMCNYLKNMEGYKLKQLISFKFDKIQEIFDKSFKRQKVEDDKETTKFKQLMEIILDEEEVAIDAIPLAVKSLRIVDWKIHKEGKKSYYKIVRADGKYQVYMFFNHMLKSFNKEDLEDLYKLVKARYGSTRPLEDLNLLLWGDLKTMFEPHIEDEIWKKQQVYKVLEWKLYDSCRVHSLRMQSMQIYMLIEKKYPLTSSTLSMMMEKNFKLILRVKWLVSGVN